MIVFSEYWSGVEVCVLHLSSLSEHKLCRTFRKRKKTSQYLLEKDCLFVTRRIQLLLRFLDATE